MNKLLTACAALLLTACDIRQEILGSARSPGASASGGGFWDLPGATTPAAPVKTAKKSDYIPTAKADEYQKFQPDMKTADQSEYFATADIGDYNPPAPPAPIFVEEEDIEEQDDILIVPVRTKTPPPVQTIKPKENFISVNKGDTLYSLARAHNVPLRDLITANKLTAPYALKPGQALYMPNQFVHSVQRGETLYSISRLYQMDLNSLAQMNKIAEPYTLKPGQKLVLPAQIQITKSESAPTAPKQDIKKDNKKDSKTTQSIPPTIPPKVVKKSTPITALPKAAARSSNKFGWPLRGTILSKFGAKSNGLYNDGINIKTTRGAPVSAAENGVVAYAGNEIKGLGNLVIIKHADGWMSVYAHLDSILVDRGKKVAVGAKIGSAGRTGKVSTPQLHFEIRKGTKAFDPLKYLKK